MESRKPSYYGPFFWLAITSFVVPIFVAAKAIKTVPWTTKPVSHPDASGVDHALWDYLLKTYVEGGLVDYDGLGRDYLFRVYLRQLSEAEPENLMTGADELALLCNAYNAFVMDGVITHRIQDSVMKYKHNDKGFFDVEEHIYRGKTISLNHLEHEIIRKRFKEPRVHVALVCAAKSCPAIRAEAFVGKRLSAQLEDQSVQFANNSKYVQFDPSDNSLRLSPLLNWYGDDWSHMGGYLPWLGERVRDEALKDVIRRDARDEIEITFFDYDWSLNSQSSNGNLPAPPARKVDFGSGSVPNE